MKNGNEAPDEDDIQSGYEECKGVVDDSDQNSGTKISKRKRLDVVDDSNQDSGEVELSEYDRYMRDLRAFIKEKKDKEIEEGYEEWWSYRERRATRERESKKMLIVAGRWAQSVRKGGTPPNMINLLPNEVAERMTDFLSFSALVKMGEVSHHWCTHVDNCARIRGLQRLLPGGRIAPLAPSALWKSRVLPVDGCEGIPVFTVSRPTLATASKVRLDCGAKGGYEDSDEDSDSVSEASTQAYVEYSD